MRKSLILLIAAFLFCTFSWSQQASIKEYKKTFTTYPFSDPDPVPEIGKFYPYYRFDGYTDKPIQKEWKVVELENDFIKVMVLPEIGGKIWAAIEKSTGQPFLYYNHVVKFRDVAMRGPWTSGGLEANYGIIGHTPNCATPVDYTLLHKSDGSVSCVIGVLDLLTRTWWHIDINLQKDKAYFTTSSFWYNASEFEEPYYTWMNAGIKAKGNLEFIYPGTKYLGHEGEYSDWPVNKDNGRDISFYENNNFGGYKSYHVFGKYTDFFGGYWHDEDFGMGRYSSHDDKPGKKIWIWGLSQQGMIWEKLLTDTDGQYVEVQSGRLFNQSAEGSTYTPFKHRGFMPHTTDKWTEYWFPVLKTKGFVAANNYGALNFKNENGWLKIYFSPLQDIRDELKITANGKTLYSKQLDIKTLQVFSDSVQAEAGHDLLITLGGNKLWYETSPSANVLNRPVESPAGFDWNSAYGLYVKGKENVRQRYYSKAEENLDAALQKDVNYVPALADYAMLLYRNMKFPQALAMAKRALSIDTYDPAANYYYGLINKKMGNIADAKDGFDIAAMGMEYRSASYTELAKIYFKDNDVVKAAEYANKSLDFNRYNVDALQMLAMISRLQDNRKLANGILDTIASYDPLNPFTAFEKYLLQNSGEAKEKFIGLIKNEMPAQTFLELAIWYYNLGRNDEAKEILALSPANAEVAYWRAFLENKALNTAGLDPALSFPFRAETREVLESLLQRETHWLLKYHLGLLQWYYNDTAAAQRLFMQCGQEPGYAPFFAARAKLFSGDTARVLSDLQHAVMLDKNEWRYGRALINYYFSREQYSAALAASKQYVKQFPQSYVLGMQYIRALLLNKQYGVAGKALQKINILPNEGATDGRQLYMEVQLMLALQEMQHKNFRKALSYTTAARQWPGNLGVGKPYESDIDERVMDWLAYENYTRLNDKKMAQQSLDKILSYTSTVKGLRPSAGNLVSAWALQKAGKREEGEKLLTDALSGQPGNALSSWALEIYNNKTVRLGDEKINNESYRVLERYIELFPEAAN